jgi:hypothetical protein
MVIASCLVFVLNSAPSIMQVPGYGLDVMRHIDTREPSPPPVADHDVLESLLGDNASLKHNLVHHIFPLIFHVHVASHLSTIIINVCDNRIEPVQHY